MILTEPPPTQYDVRFNIGSIPVRISPWFWLVSALLGIQIDGPTAGNQLLIWMFVVFISILVHELGHAMAAMACGWPPRIVLTQMGGLAIYRPTYHHVWRQVGILLAGPGAGFLLAALLLANLAIMGYTPSFFLHPWQEADGGFPVFRTSILSIALAQPLTGENFYLFVIMMLQFNIFWGFINLLPVFPLDGGQIARELLQNADRRNGLKQSLQLSILTGGLLAVLGMSMGSTFMVLLFAILAFQSWQMLEQISQGGGGQWR